MAIPLAQINESKDGAGLRNRAAAYFRGRNDVLATQKRERSDFGRSAHVLKPRIGLACRPQTLQAQIISNFILGKRGAAIGTLNIGG